VSASSATVAAPSAEPSPRPSSGGPAGRSRGERRVLLLAGLYCLLGAVAVTMWLWRDPASRIVAANPYDTDQFAWYFRYDAAAVAHFRLPALISDGMNAPQGISLMWNTFMPLPGVLLAPLTLLAGPQASLTVLMTAGFAGSALAMFWVLRRWGAGLTAAGLGCAVYGFSPALVQSSLGHYDLQFAVLPPLIADAALRLLTGRYGNSARSAVRPGAWLGALVTAQLFISEELLFDTGIAVLIMTAVASLPRATRAAGAARAVAARAVAAGLATAAAITITIAGYPLWVQFLGPLRQHTSPFTPDFYKNDLAGFVRPSSLMLLHTAGSAAFAQQFQGGEPEYLAYLGLPLLVVLAVATVAFWRLRPVRVCAVSFAVLATFSLGGTLLAGGHEHEGITLPWYWLQTLPVTGSVIPDRFSIVADGLAAAALAFGLDAALARWCGTGRSGAPRPENERPRAPRPSTPRPWARWVVTGAAVAAVVPLVPRPLPAASAPGVPAGWTAVFAALRPPAGGHVLVLPIPVATYTKPLRWAADTGDPASMVGGYYMGPTWSGPAATDGNGLSSEAMYLNQLWAKSAGVSATVVGVTLPPNQVYPDAAQVRGQLAGWKLSDVVAVTSPDSALGRYLTRLLGPPQVTAGRVMGWDLPNS
jgi:hypothetical protein